MINFNKCNIFKFSECLFSKIVIKIMNQGYVFIEQPYLWRGSDGYLSEGDRDSSIQLNVISQLSELVLLLLKSFQQTLDLLLGQHNPAVILHQERSNSFQCVVHAH